MSIGQPQAGDKGRRAVLVGAGFAGLWAARTLAAQGFSVTIVDRNNYHTFLPLLYQVAAAELEPEQIAYPVRGIFRGTENVRLSLAEVRDIDFAGRTLLTDTRPIEYDYLLLAAGSVTRFFRTPGAADHAFSLKTLEEGITLRNHLLTCFERAETEPFPEAKHALRTFIVVGGGPTGVEYAGALSELIRGPLARDFGCRNMCEARILILEAGGSILPVFPDRLRHYAAGRLRHMGVEVMTGAKVERVEADGVRLADGTFIRAATTVWTAGVKGTPAAGAWGLPTGPDGRVRVLPTLQLDGHPEVFVAGDLASVPGKPLPMIAPVAIQQGRHAALGMIRLAEGRPAETFAYRDKGAMATIGRGAAVVTLGRWSFTGLPAWILWLFIHLLYLVGFRNRLIVLASWAADYFLFERAVRLILPRDPLWPRRFPPTTEP